MNKSPKTDVTVYIRGIEVVLPKKICLGDGCNTLIKMKSKYCSDCGKVKAMNKRDHNRKYDEFVRDAEIVRFYHSTAWKRVRSYVLIRDNHLCQECLKNGIIRSAELVHHIVEVKDDWSKKLSVENCISICSKCHRLKHS